ncbi:MAG TPA: cellulose binding domain-containing protein [Terracidiphilus sp.]|nr:cellulose binding domain-containing protein [Terracidiphilus sp.]
MISRLIRIAAAPLCFLLPVLAGGQTTVNFNTTYQTVRGFGGSESWMPQMSSGEANALFGTGNGQIGLSILRVRIDPSSTTGGSNWATELANAQEAAALGATIIATPWTPPAAWKSSNSTVEGTLNTSHYGDFANYLNAFTTYLKNGGVNLYAISMQNEPDANVTYESCVWTGATMDTWVANNSGVLTTKLMMPESESFTTSFSDPALNDSNAVGKIAIVAGHLYGTSPSYYTNAENKGKEVWETEHYLSPSGSQPTISDAIAAAKEIHNSMTVGYYNAYLWWWIADWNPGSGVTNYGLVDTSNNPTYYGYALGQFSKFVRPGSVRVSATGAPSGVLVSAYKGSTSSAIVAVNTNGSSTSLPVNIQNLSVGSVTPYQTTSSGGLVAQSAVNVSNGSFSYTLPANSIVTFVTSGSGGNNCGSVPAAPAGVTATAASSSSINVSWMAVTPPTNCSLNSYTVFRSTTSGFTPSSANQVGSVSGTSFSDTGLAASTTYYYKVEAVDSDGSSPASSQASATTQSGGGGGGACEVDYTISTFNSSQFGATMAIKNGGSTTLTNWKLTWSFANGQTITSSWNGTVSQSGGNVTVTEQSGQSWENIPPGGSYTGFGFNGSWNGSTNAIPTNFALNGTACTIN